MPNDKMKSPDLPMPLHLHHIPGDRDNHCFQSWLQKQIAVDLLETLNRPSQLVFSRIPKSPVRILHVGCRLGAIPSLLAKAEHRVVVVDPSDALIGHARINNPGPEYICCDFLDEHPKITFPEQYDIILFQDSLQNSPDLRPVFGKARSLLQPETGRLIISETVSYDPEIHTRSEMLSAMEIEKKFNEEGFFVRYHQPVGLQLASAYRSIVQLLQEKRGDLSAVYVREPDKTIDGLINGLKKLSDLFLTRKEGYEIWDIRPSNIQIHPYQQGDAKKILSAFQSAFNIHRDLNHWQWKFPGSPFGEPAISLAWAGDNLLAQYTGYPLPCYQQGRDFLTYQVGDIFTLPSCRSIGRGKTSILGRIARHFYRQYCEGKIPFFYGFCTDPHRKFGRKFLDYHPVSQVNEWVLNGEALSSLMKSPGLKFLLSGYTVQKTDHVQEWADTVFRSAKDDYGLLVSRTRKYLEWRYQNHPDHNYIFFVVRRWGKPVGWWLAREDNHILQLGDALFCRESKKAPYFGLAAGLRLLDSCGSNIDQVRGWFSETPGWWNESLRNIGFSSHKHPYNIDLCIIPFAESIDPAQIGKQFYFTAGDSDLF